MLAIDILRSYFPKGLGVLRGDFWMFGCPKDAQTACWLRLWSQCYFRVFANTIIRVFLVDTGINGLTYQKPNSPQENSLAFIF